MNDPGLVSVILRPGEPAQPVEPVVVGAYYAGRSGDFAGLALEFVLNPLQLVHRFFSLLVGALENYFCPDLWVIIYSLLFRLNRTHRRC